MASLGIDGRESGDEFVAPCPQHAARTGREDSHPSWSINLRSGLHICFSCGYRGTLAGLVSDLGGDADLAEARPDLRATVARIPGPYLVVEPQRVEEHRLGRFVLPPRWARERRLLTAQACADHGVLWDPDQDAWIIPIREPSGTLMGWQAKSESGRAFRNYPFGVKKSRCLFGLDAFSGGRMVVVESPLDAVRLTSEGIGGGVATFGATVSAAQVLLMTAADEVVIALDADDAGRKAAARLLSATRGVLRSVRFFDYSRTRAKDVGEMTRDEIEAGIAGARSRAHGQRALA